MAPCCRLSCLLSRANRLPFIPVRSVHSRTLALVFRLLCLFPCQCLSHFILSLSVVAMGVFRLAYAGVGLSEPRRTVTTLTISVGWLPGEIKQGDRAPDRQKRRQRRAWGGGLSAVGVNFNSATSVIANDSRRPKTSLLTPR